jgi:drug/metabolite transporter (DMT)-like permease
MNTETESKASRAMLIAAFATIYIVWGSTYAAIRVVVETMPPFLSAAVRFLVAGSLMLALLAARGVPVLSRAQWRYAAVTGTLMLVGGNGLVVWAERTLSSGFTALLIALVPVWFALMDWLRPRGNRPQLKTVLGIAVGFAGIVLLVKARGGLATMNGQWTGALAIVVSGMCWAGGSIYAKYQPNTASPWMTSAAQMLCGGAGLLLVATVRGEPFNTEWSQISGRSLAAQGYLIVFGSWIGFSAYVWLLKASTPARISTYAYVNPVIAVFLGWVMLGERMNAGMLGAATVIVLGVAIITIPPTAIASTLRRVAGLIAGRSFKAPR